MAYAGVRVPGAHVTWFKVDDSFHSHPKAAAASLAALGLWTVAGAWCGDHLTDGFIPDHMVPMLSRGATQLADELVAAGLWRRVRKGYQFHQWNERNPEASHVREVRAKRAAAGRIGGLKSGEKREANAKQTRSNAVAENGANRNHASLTSDDVEAKSKHFASAFASTSANPRPDPSRRDGVVKEVTKGDSSVTREGSEPPRKCQNHTTRDANGPCGPCADARRANEQWHAAKRDRIATAAKCDRHTGELAHNCRACASERLERPTNGRHAALDEQTQLLPYLRAVPNQETA